MCLRNVTVYKNLIRSTVITACEIWVLTKDMTDRRYGKNMNAQRTRWLGHIWKTDECMIVKKVLDSNWLNNRERGRPKNKV